MNQDEAQSNFREQYTMGVRKLTNFVFGLPENKHGIENQVVDLNVGKSKISGNVTFNGSVIVNPPVIITLQNQSGVLALQNATTLTATQVLFADSTGLLVQSANLTFVSPALTIGVAGSTTGQLKLTGATSGVVTVQTATTAGTWSLTLPTNDGNNLQFLQTNGSGVTTWADALILGTDTRVLFFDGTNNPAGVSSFTFNKTTYTITLGIEDNTSLITAANATTIDTAAGDINISGGIGNGTGQGGNAEILGGVGGVTGEGGDVALRAGAAGGGDTNGGKILIRPGVKSGAGVDGFVLIGDPSSGNDIQLDLTPLTTSQTVIFPDVTGTVVLTASHARAITQTAANTNVLTFTVGSADATFQLMANVLITASATHTIAVTVDYTDESNTTRTLTLPFSQLAGTIINSITNVTGAGPYEGVGLTIRAKTATNIVFKTAGVFTSVTYNVDASIVQVATI